MRALGLGIVVPAENFVYGATFLKTNLGCYWWLYTEHLLSPITVKISFQKVAPSTKIAAATMIQRSSESR